VDALPKVLGEEKDRSKQLEDERLLAGGDVRQTAHNHAEAVGMRGQLLEPGLRERRSRGRQETSEAQQSCVPRFEMEAVWRRAEERGKRKEEGAHAAVVDHLHNASHYQAQHIHILLAVSN